MKREPGIHINKSSLVLVLNKVLNEDFQSGVNIKALADCILEEAKVYSLTHRQLNVDKAKLLKSSSRLVLSTRDSASSFASLLTLVRKQRRHKGINIIKPGSRDWLMIKEIAKLALDFCNDFDLEREEGFKEYINIALDKMVKFGLMKFNSMHQSICDDYGAKLEIKNDLTPNLTLDCQMVYEKLLGEKHGIVRDYSKNPDKFVYFIKAKDEAKKCGVTIQHYIKSQFWGLEWANAIPDPAQLVGPKAIDRLNRYITEHNLRPQEEMAKNRDAELAKKLREKLYANH